MTSTDQVEGDGVETAAENKPQPGGAAKSGGGGGGGGGQQVGRQGKGAKGGRSGTGGAKVEAPKSARR